MQGLHLVLLDVLSTPLKHHTGSTGSTDVSAGNLDSRAMSEVVQVLTDRQHLVVIDALVKAALLACCKSSLSQVSFKLSCSLQGDETAAIGTLQQLVLIDVSTVIAFREESEGQ